MIQSNSCIFMLNLYVNVIVIFHHFLSISFINLNPCQEKQARKLQATLEGCKPKLSPTDSLTDRSKV